MLYDSLVAAAFTLPGRRALRWTAFSHPFFFTLAPPGPTYRQFFQRASSDPFYAVVAHRNYKPVVEEKYPEKYGR